MNQVELLQVAQSELNQVMWCVDGAVLAALAGAMIVGIRLVEGFFDGRL